ncbi:MAG TPA: branched-chain amino acid ABC transporter permease [Anaerolineae bacterium]|nr:branched-chain amino acid ABC transporter permease [Anaerolineae bacterium]
MKRNWLKITGLLLLLGLLLSVPLVITSPYHLHIVIISGIFVLLAASLNLITGYSGRLNLGHAAFYGIGAYTSALLALRLNVPFWLGLPSGGLLSVLFGVLIGLPCLRLKGPYLAIATLGFGEITRLVLHNWVSLTNGPLGLRGIPGPPSIAIPGLLIIEFDSKISYYYLLLAVLTASLYVIYRLINSELGRTFLAIREDETLAEMIGIDTTRAKLMNFAVAAFFAGVAGSLYAHYVRFISPETFSFLESSAALTMVVIGGLGTFVGPILGGIIFSLLPEFLRAVAEFRMIIYGATLSISIFFMPKGLAGLLDSIYVYVRTRSEARFARQTTPEARRQ